MENPRETQLTPAELEDLTLFTSEGEQLVAVDSLPEGARRAARIALGLIRTEASEQLN